jgi:hypothetical protein
MARTPGTTCSRESRPEKVTRRAAEKDVEKGTKRKYQKGFALPSIVMASVRTVSTVPIRTRLCLHRVLQVLPLLAKVALHGPIAQHHPPLAEGERVKGNLAVSG